MTHLQVDQRFFYWIKYLLEITGISGRCILEGMKKQTSAYIIWIYEPPNSQRIVVYLYLIN